MQVSVESLKGLERKLTISVPTEKIEKEVTLRLKDLANKAHIHGFRPGKVPMRIIQERFSSSVCRDVGNELIQSTLYEAAKENQFTPISVPLIEIKQLEIGKDFIYTAQFEIYPTIKLVEENNKPIEIIDAEITEADINKVIENLLEQNKEWKEVSGNVAEGNKVIIDFHTVMENEKSFAEKHNNNHFNDYEMIIDSNNKLSFSEALIGKKCGQSITASINYPQDYNDSEYAGKEITFNITIHKVLKGIKPELDINLFKKFDVETLEDFRKEVEESMNFELKQRLKIINKHRIFDHLLQVNDFELPNALIKNEINKLRHQLFHKLHGEQHHDEEKIPDYPKELFEKSAEHNVKCGLLMSDYVKKHQLVADPKLVNDKIESLASIYKNPDRIRDWYKNNKEQLGAIEALVMEEMVSEKIAQTATLIEKKISYTEATELFLNSDAAQEAE